VSKLSDHVYDLLKQVFPNNIIKTEHYIRYKGKRLFFDFYIKDLGILLEVQGKQHDEFVKHFHTDREGFLAAKRRDNLKKEYCQINDLWLIEVRSKISKQGLVDRIWREMKDAFKPRGR
jgi:hypothetical protein